MATTPLVQRRYVDWRGIERTDHVWLDPDLAYRDLKERGATKVRVSPWVQRALSGTLPAKEYGR